MSEDPGTMVMQLPAEQVVDGVRFHYIPPAEVEPSHIAAATAAMDLAFEGWPGFPIPVPAVDHLTWKLEKPGELVPVLGLMTLPDGATVGTSVLLPRSYLFRGTRRRVADWCDSSIAPQLQGRGLYRTRLQYSRRLDPHFEFTMNFSRHPRILSSRRRRNEGGSLANTLRTLVRPFDARAMARGLEEGPRRVPRPILGVATGTVSRLTRLRYRRSLPKPADVEITRPTRFDERVEDLFARAASQFDLVEVRDLPFMNWRYGDRRAGEFTPLLATEGDQLLGYAVLAPRDDRLIIADLLALPARSDVVSALVLEALRSAKEADAAAASAWLPHRHPYREVLMGYGFFDAGSRSGINVRNIALSREEDAVLHLDRSTRIHVMQGDTDSI